jgi:hypothetical protein
LDPPVAGQEPAVVAELAKDREVLRFEPDQDGRRRRVVVDLDGASFTDTWLRTVQAVNKADQRLGLLIQDNAS